MNHTHTHTRSRRLSSVAGAVLAGALALSACSSGEDPAAAAGRSTNPEMVDLAARIEAAQAPETETLTGWLADWDAASGGSGGRGSMGNSGSGMPGMSGMMSAEDMSTLEGTSGMDFDHRWLEMMLEHHTGAVSRAQTEIADGEDVDAIALAEDITAAQGAEITELERLLQSLTSDQEQVLLSKGAGPNQPGAYPPVV